MPKPELGRNPIVTESDALFTNQPASCKKPASSPRCATRARPIQCPSCGIHKPDRHEAHPISPINSWRSWRTWGVVNIASRFKLDEMGAAVYHPELKMAKVAWPVASWRGLPSLAAHVPAIACLGNFQSRLRWRSSFGRRGKKSSTIAHKLQKNRRRSPKIMPY